MRIKIFLSILCVAGYFLRAQTGVNISGLQGADSLINKFLTTWRIDGAGVALTKNGKLIYNKGFGFSDQAHVQTTKPYNLFRVASVSKPITAIAIMKLVENGSLSLEDTVFGKNKLLPQAYYLDAITDKRINSITVQHLLEHTAGWDRSVSCDGFSHSDYPFFPLHITTVLHEANPVGDSALIKFSLMKGLNNKPGTEYAYSNVGYLILGKIIEHVSGMKYEDFVKEYIFHPISIYDIHLGKNLLIEKQEREVEYCNAYTEKSCYGDGSTVKAQYGGFNLEAMNAHGGWIASAADLTKLMLATDGDKTCPDILKRETIDLMTKPSAVGSGYAKGWFVNGKGNYWHTGSIDGSATFICRANNGYTWAFLFNSRSDNSEAFWNAFDSLPWNCIKVLSDIPAMDLFAPANNVSTISANVIDRRTVTLNWKNGNGDGRIVFASEDSVLSYFPVDGTELTVSTAFGSGPDLGNRTFAVFAGPENNFTLTNLNPGKKYFMYAFEYYKNPTTRNNIIYKLAQGGKAVISTADKNIDP